MLEELIKSFKKKAQPQTGQGTGQTGGAEAGIMAGMESLRPGSQLPGDSAEAEETRTNRRQNRSITNGLRNQRIQSRFGSF